MIFFVIIFLFFSIPKIAQAAFSAQIGAVPLLDLAPATILPNKDLLCFEPIFTALENHVKFLIANSSDHRLSSDCDREKYHRFLMIQLYEAIIKNIESFCIDEQQKNDVIVYMASSLIDMTKEEFSAFVPVEKMFDEDVQQNPKLLRFEEFEIRLISDFKQKYEQLRELPKFIKPSISSGETDCFLFNCSCPQEWREYKRIFQDDLKKRKIPFFGNVFDILACQIDIVMITAPEIIFFANDQIDVKKIEEIKNQRNREILQYLYQAVIKHCTNDLCREYLEDSLKEIPCQQLSQLIVLKNKIFPDQKKDELDVHAHLFHERVKLNFEKKCENLKKSRTMSNGSKFVALEPESFASKKELLATCQLVGRKCNSFKMKFDEEFCKIIAEKVCGCLERMSDDFFYSFKASESTVVLKKSEVKVKKLDFYKKVLFDFYCILLNDVQEKWLHDQKNMHNKLNGLSLDDYLKAQTDAIKNIAEKELVESLFCASAAIVELPFIVKIKELSATAFESNLVQILVQIKERKDKDLELVKREENVKIEQEKIKRNRAQQITFCSDECFVRQNIQEEESNSFERRWFLRQNLLNNFFATTTQQMEAEFAKSKSEVEKIVKNSNFALFLQKYLRNKTSEVLVKDLVKSLEVRVVFKNNQKRINAYQKMIKANQEHAELCTNRKEINLQKEKELQAQYKMVFDRSVAEWQSTMRDLKENMQLFDHDFEKWQQAILFIQKILKQKQIDQQKIFCANSFETWKIAVSKLLKDHSHDTQVVFNEDISEVQKNINEANVSKLLQQNDHQKRSTWWSVWSTLVIQQKNKQAELAINDEFLTDQYESLSAAPLFVDALECEDPECCRLGSFECADGFHLYGHGNGSAQDEDGGWYRYNPRTRSWDVCDEQNVNEKLLQSEKYTYWQEGDCSFSQDDQGCKYVWCKNLQKWKLFTEHESKHASFAVSMTLSQAQKNGWALTTEKELQDIYTLNFRAAEIYKKRLKK